MKVCVYSYQNILLINLFISNEFTGSKEVFAYDPIVMFNVVSKCEVLL